MFSIIKKFLQRVLNHPTGIEEFIASKNPQTAGDVDHWMRVYSNRNGAHNVF